MAQLQDPESELDVIPLGPDTWLTGIQCAELLGVSRNTIYTALREGRIPSTEHNGRLEVTLADLLDWVGRKKAYEIALAALMAFPATSTREAS